jgi:putative protease
MSPKDLCTLPFLEKVIQVGVSSLKIEGRNRSPEYVLTTATAYREVRDAILEQQSERKIEQLKAKHIEQLKRVFNRGFSSGFFLGKPIDQWTGGGSEATVKKEVVGIVINYFAKVNAAEIVIQASVELAPGDRLIFQGPTTGSFESSIESMQVEGRPVDAVGKGQHVAIQVPQRVRRNDRVFVVQDA